MSDERLTVKDFDSAEKFWKCVFAIFGCVLVVVLVDLEALGPTGVERIVCFAFGTISVSACLYAAKKLRDLERVHAVADADWLLGTHLPEVADGDD